MDLFVPPGSGGLAAPIALAFMPLSNTSSSGVEPVDWERRAEGSTWGCMGGGGNRTHGKAEAKP